MIGRVRLLCIFLKWLDKRDFEIKNVIVNDFIDDKFINENLNYYCNLVSSPSNSLTKFRETFWDLIHKYRTTTRRAWKEKLVEIIWQYYTGSKVIFESENERSYYMYCGLLTLESISDESERKYRILDVNINYNTFLTKKKKKRLYF